MSKIKIILASKSIGRKMLLKKMGLKFRCVPSNYHEDMSVHTRPKKLAVYLALNKAIFIAPKLPDSIIISADTFITLRKKSGKKSGNKFITEKIGKPRDISDAKKIIASMSGKTISVHSGIAVIKTAPRGGKSPIKKHTDYDLTKLKIKKMSPAEIDFLAHQKNALKISGAFSIEGAGGKMIEKITGDYDNVIGLPTYKLKKILKKITD